MGTGLELLASDLPVRRLSKKIEHLARRSILAGVVNRPSTFRPLRAACAMVMLLSWLVLSNHCALGDVSKDPRAAQMHSACCGNQQPAGEPHDSAPQECCKSLNVLPAVTAKIAVTTPPILVDLAALFAAAAVEVEAPRLLEWMDSGPPRASSFAEIVLQQSLLSHAPPRAA